MTAGQYDFIIEQGAGFNRVITYRAGGVLVNLTGYTATLTAKHKRGAVASLLSMSTGGHGITLGGAAGTITLALTDSETALLDFEQAVYMLELTPASGDDVRLLEGNITLSKAV